jgi:hypothetical protein
MAFLIHGKIGSTKVVVGWDGKPTAEPWLLKFFKFYCQGRKGQFIGYEPAAGDIDHYEASAPASCAIWMNILDIIDSCKGDMWWEEHIDGATD